MIWHTEEISMIPFTSFYMFHFQCHCFISQWNETGVVCNDVICGDQNTFFYWFLSNFMPAFLLSSGFSNTDWAPKVIAFISNKKSSRNPLFKICPEIFQTASLKTSNPKVNFQCFRAADERMQLRRKDVLPKKGQKEENWFQVPPSDVAQESVTAFVCAADDAVEAVGGLLMWYKVQMPPEKAL